MLGISTRVTCITNNSHISFIQGVGIGYEKAHMGWRVVPNAGVEAPEGGERCVKAGLDGDHPPHPAVQRTSAQARC